MILGDFNGRSPAWGDLKYNPRGRLIEDWIYKNELVIHNKHEKFIPTFINSRGYQSIPDLVISSADLTERVKIEEILMCFLITEV